MDQLLVLNKHVSCSLFADSSPKKAQEILIEIEYELKNKNFNVKRSPFGWYKAFTISCKGHPLSELSREIIPGGEETESLKQERKLSSYWHILTKDGKLHDIGTFNFKGHDNLKKFAFYAVLSLKSGTVTLSAVERERSGREMSLNSYISFCQSLAPNRPDISSSISCKLNSLPGFESLRS